MHKIDTGIKCTRMLVLEGIKNEFLFSFLHKSVFFKFAARCWKKNDKREIGYLRQSCPTNLGLGDFREGWSVMAADGQTGSPVRWPFGFTPKRRQGPAAGLPSVSILGCGEVGEHIIVLGASGQGGGRWGRQTLGAAFPLAQGFSWGKSLPLLASVSSSAK